MMRNDKLIVGVVILSIVIIILQLPVVKAGFVCGQVKDSQEMSAHWYEVRISHLGEGKYAECEISPAENKYCCDPEAIPDQGWKIGDIMQTEIFDAESGYVAGPVSKTTTGEGFDIMPEMTLEKAIKLNNFEKLLISNQSKFLLNASFLYPYNYVELEKEGNKTVLCDDCTEILEIIDANFGMSNMNLYASSNDRVL